jgi:hypothetical protein
MQAFDENECDFLAKALDRAYLVFLAAGQLNEKNIDIAKSMLTRAVIQRFQHGERDEFELAAYAQNVFSNFMDEVSARDLSYLKGTLSNDRIVGVVHHL